MRHHSELQLTRSVYAGQAGFTLVELMVAMTGGLFLSIVVFALSRDASRFYQSETRAANATLAGVTGFERLSNDIARAGHLISPNIDNDPRVCNRPQSWPALLQNLRAISLDTSDITGTELETAGIDPMAIVLAGSLDVTEELPINHVGPNADGAMAVTLREDTPAARRLNLRTGVANVAHNKAVLLSLFRPGGTGRAVRITQLDGMEQYAIVADVVSEPLLQITLLPTPALQFRSSAGGTVQCGFRGFTTGGSINVINFVRYQLRSMISDSNYASLFAASAAAGLPYEAGRVELTREELTPAGALMAGTREIVAEYAVDLQFAVKQATSSLNPALTEPAPATITATYGSTQLLRGVHVRFSVRSREADREADVSGMPAGDIYRIGLGSDGLKPYARVRTFQADVPLRNLEGANWP
jgi:type II secretory pathway pseudopilin PulG